MKTLVATLMLVSFCEAKTCREQAIDDTLAMTLLVGAEMREQHKKPTWLDIQTEVYRRLATPTKQKKHHRK